MATTFARRVTFAGIALLALHVCSGAKPVSGVPVSGVPVSGVPGLSGRFDNFSLPAIDDQVVSLSTEPSVQLHVICFLGTECPLARIYGPRLERMSSQYASRGVEFIGINSNIQDSMGELKEYATQHGISFPIVKDYDRQVALQAGATRTPEVFVIDRAAPSDTRDESTTNTNLGSRVAPQRGTSYATRSTSCLLGKPSPSREPRRSDA